MESQSSTSRFHVSQGGKFCVFASSLHSAIFLGLHDRSLPWEGVGEGVSRSRDALFTGSGG